MSVVKFTATLVAESSSTLISTVSYAAVAQVTDFLAQQDTRATAGTLELARSVEPQQCLQDVDFQAGDRLVIFTQALRAESFAPLRPGDKALRLTIGAKEISANGKQTLVIGKSDEKQQLLVDVDLRGVVPDRSLDFISRQSVQLVFDAYAQGWSLVKLGQTRVVLDDLEVLGSPVALNTHHTLRLYRANDQPATSRPLVEIRLLVETVRALTEAQQMLVGSYPVPIMLGLEGELHTLRASTNLPLGQIGTSLIQYVQPVTISDMRLYLMRLIPPQTRVSALKATEQLYAARRL